MTQIETPITAYTTPGTAASYETITPTDMIEADLRATNLAGTVLRDVRADRAALAMADLRNVDARNMGLLDADLRGALLSRADLRGADLRGADLGGASHDAATRWDGAVISLRTTLPDDLDLTGDAGGLVIDPAD